MAQSLASAALPDGYGEALVPISLCKAWCRVLHDDEDLVITALRDAAIEMVERIGNLHMAPRTGMIATFDTLASALRVDVGLGEPLEVTAISYRDQAGTLTSLAGGWSVDASKAIVLSGASAIAIASDVAVTFDAGYPESACPGPLKTAALMYVAFLYANREAIIMGTFDAEPTLGFRAQVERYRMPLL